MVKNKRVSMANIAIAWTLTKGLSSHCGTEQGGSNRRRSSRVKCSPIGRGDEVPRRAVRPKEGDGSHAESKCGTSKTKSELSARVSLICD